MNNGEREFNAMLTSVERELTDIKTSHQHPLGSLDFYQKKQAVTVNLDYSYGFYNKTFWIDITIQTPSVAPPIVQVGWDIPNGFNYMDLFEYQINATYSVWSYKLNLGSPDLDSATFNVSAVASLPILSISTRGV